MLLSDAGVVIGTARGSSSERMDGEVVTEGSCELLFSLNVLIFPGQGKLLSSLGDSERGES